jgi:hypothetical protein
VNKFVRPWTSVFKKNYDERHRASNRSADKIVTGYSPKEFSHPRWEFKAESTNTHTSVYYWGAVSVRKAVRLVGAALAKGGIE